MTSERTTQLTFAHLSDPHLTSLHGVNWRQLTNKRILGYLSWRHKRRDEHRSEVLEALQRDLERTHPQQIVITGDLTHIGLPDEFRQARRWLDQLGSTDTITVIPGNHDAYINAPWHQTMALWEPYMKSDFVTTADRVEASQELFPSLRVRGPLALIGLSSARASAPFFATGALGQMQMERLSVLLQKTAEQGLFRVVLLHHPPRPEDDKWRKRLTDGARLCELLEQYGAEMVLHGHTHRPMHRLLNYANRQIPVFGVASASSIGKKPGRRAQYNVFDIKKQQGGWDIHQTVRGYQLESDTFVLAHEHHLHIPE